MNNGLSRAMGTMLLVAAVFAATSCTTPGSPNVTPSSSAPSSAGQSPNAEPLGPSSSTPAAGATATTTPTDNSAAALEAQAQQPQPAPEPTFAPSEQKYLASRVPEGNDPNAVLQEGQEICAQFEAAKAVDPMAVVSQMIENKDAEKAAAVADLCPGLQPELDAAARGFTDGEFTIGAAAASKGTGSIAPGNYEAWNPSPTCMLVAYDAAGGRIAESTGTSTFTIPTGAARVVSDGCYTWLSV
jgi:hypothetical protein